jgi:hypothetical protein
MDDYELSRTLTYTKFQPENLEGRHHSRDLNVDGMIMLKSQRKRREDVDWVHLAQDVEPNGRLF